MNIHHSTYKHILLNMIKSNKFRISAIAIASLYITGLLVLKNSCTEANDPIPNILQLKTKTKNKASLVTIGLHINSFPTFSFTKNEFIIDGILWFKFPQGAESIKQIENFTIQNSLLQENGILLYKSSPIIKLIDHDVLVCYHIQTSFKANLDYHNFPMENHRLFIIIQNKSATPEELYFQSDSQNITIAKDNLLGYWQPREASVKTGYIQANLHHSDPELSIHYPVAAFSINFENIGVRNLASLYFPMFVLFFIALFCLFIDISDISRLSYVAAAIPTLALFRLVIDGVSPHVGYSTHVDFTYYLLVFLSLLILLFQTYVVLTLQTTKHLSKELQEPIKARLSFLNDWVFILTLATLVICITLSCL